MILLWIAVGFWLLFLLIGIGANILAWWTGKLRLDVLTFLYLPIWSLWLFLPLMLAIVVSIAELVGGRQLLWRNTWGARFAMVFVGAFFGNWLGSVISGMALRYVWKWPDGPTLKVEPPKP